MDFSCILLTCYADDYRLCALGVVSEYLLPELADALQVLQTWQPCKFFMIVFQERLGIEEKKPSLGQFKRQSVGGQDGPKTKKAKHEGRFEYCHLDQERS